MVFVPFMRHAGLCIAKRVENSLICRWEHGQMSRIYARACLSGPRRRLSGITDGSGLRTYTPSKRRASVAIRCGARLVSSCVDGSCLMPTTTTASTTKTSPMTATARINMAGISAQLLTDKDGASTGQRKYTPGPAPSSQYSREVDGCVAAHSVATDCGPGTPIWNPQAVSRLTFGLGD